MSEHLVESDSCPYDFAIVDEAQDIGVASLRFLAAVGSRYPNSLFCTGESWAKNLSTALLLAVFRSEYSGAISNPQN